MIQHCIFTDEKQSHSYWDPKGTSEKNRALKKFKECALASLRKSCRPETKTTVNRYVYHDLSMWNRRLNQNLLEHNLPSRRKEKRIWNKQHFSITCRPTTAFHCYGSWKSEIRSRKLEVGSRKTLLGFRKWEIIANNSYSPNTPLTCVLNPLSTEIRPILRSLDHLYSHDYFAGLWTGQN